MVNSASQSLAEFKAQRMGGLLSNTSSTVSPASMYQGNSLSDTAADRMQRSTPSNSSTAFLENIRNSGKRLTQIAQEGAARRQAAYAGQNAQQPGYALPSGGQPQTGGPRGQYGLTVPAAAAFNKLAGAYKAAGNGDLGIISGGRTYAQQQQLYAAYKAGKGNLAAKPGTSLHESGIAADLGGAAHSSATKQHAWLRQNAAQYGWYWVGQRFGEAWHWEYHPEWGR